MVVKAGVHVNNILLFAYTLVTAAENQLRTLQLYGLFLNNQGVVVTCFY